MPCVEDTEDFNLPIRALKALSIKAGMDESFELESLPGGRNNRAFRMRARDQVLFLKFYYHRPWDTRARLKREFEFLEYLWSQGIRSVPRPVCADYTHHLGLYEFVQGRRLRLQEIGPQHIDEAIDFFQYINSARSSLQGRRLACAAEACFSVAEHLQGVGKRVDSLKKMEIKSEVEAEAKRFCRDELIPLWESVHVRVMSQYRQNGLLHENFRATARRISPSDFGYHNALLEKSGKLRFLDFEYAGWDDPAKLACDFANQPDMLLPEKLSLRFQSAVIESSEEPETLRQRILWLTPVYQVKWSCIILNEFLPDRRNHALFVQGREEEQKRKTEQLLKSQQMLARAAASLEKISYSSQRL